MGLRTWGQFRKFLGRLDGVARRVMRFFRPIDEGVAQTSVLLVVSLIGVFVTLLVFLKRFMEFFGILGFDSPFYIYLAEVIEKYGVGAVLRRDKVSVGLLAYLLLVGLGDFECVGVALPVILGVVYVVASVVVAYCVSRSGRLSFCVAVVAALNFHFIRVSYDLYGQLMANSLMLMLLYLISRVIDPGSSRFGDFLKIYTVFMLLFLTHFWTSILLISFFLILNVGVVMYYLFVSRKFSVRDLRLHVITMVAVALGGLLFVVYKMYAIFWLLEVMRREFHYFSFSLGWLWFPGEEHPVVWLLAVIGVLVAFYEDRRFGFVVSSWISYIVALIFFTGYVQSYRFVLLFPLPVLIGFGLYGVYTALTRLVFSLSGWGRVRIGTVRLLRVLVLLLTFLILLNCALASSYIPCYNYRPGDKVLEQMFWVREKFRFENESVLVVIDRSLLNASYYWPVMVIGSNVYFGRLEDLVMGLEDFRGVWFPDWERRDIIVLDSLYHITAFEERISQRISKVGVYRVINKNVSYWEEVLFSVGRKLDPRLFTVSNVSTLDAEVHVASGGLRIMVAAGASGVLMLLYSFDGSCAGCTISRVVIKARSNIEGLRLSILAYSCNGTVIGRSEARELSEEYLWYVLDIKGGKDVCWIAIMISSVRSSAYTGVIEIPYVIVL